jgi:hypothetical protein
MPDKQNSKDFKVMAMTLPTEELYQHFSDLVKVRKFAKDGSLKQECSERINILTLELGERIRRNTD